MRSNAGKRRSLQRQKDLLLDAAAYLAQHGDANVVKSGHNLMAESEFGDIDDDDDEDDDGKGEKVGKERRVKRFGRE